MIKKILVFLLSATLAFTSVFIPCASAADISQNSGRYIVLLDTPPVSEAELSPGSVALFSADAEDIEETIEDAQTAVLSSIEDGQSSGFAVVDSLDTVLNAVIIEGNNLDIDKIAEIPGVAEVYQDIELPLSDTEDSADFSFNKDALSRYRADGLRGEGSVIAVIDGAFQANHPAFKLSDNSTARITQQTLTQAGFKSSFYLSPKVPYYKSSLGTNAPTSLKNHGTHVAGIAAGNDNILQGAAPEAQLLLIEAGTSSGGVSLANALSGIEDAVKLGADSINMSFGVPVTSAEDPKYNALRRAIKNASNLGITVCHSAGNDGRDMAPNSTGENKQLTANTDYKRSAEFAADTELTVGSVNLGDSYSSLRVTASNGSTQLTVTLAAVNSLTHSDADARIKDMIKRGTAKIVYCSGGESDSDFPSAVSGNIALIRRNIVNGKALIYSVLAERAFKNGAVGVIVSDAKDESSATYRTLIRPVMKDPLPQSSFVLGMAPLHADKLVSAMKNGSMNIISSEITHSSSNGVTVYDGQPSSFSSYGVTNDLKLVPSVSAYGSLIYSSVSDSNYGSNRGTSMSSPYVAGVSAAIKQSLKERGLSGAELDKTTRNLLMTTADLGRQPNGVYHSPRKIGLGNINAQNALDAQSLILGSSDLPKIDLGEVGGEIPFSFTVRNISNKTAVYTLSGETMTDGYEYSDSFGAYVISDEEIALGSAFDFDCGDTITVPANSSVTAHGKLTLDAANTDALSEVFTNGFFVDGLITLASQSGSPDLHCALMGYFGDWSAAPAIDPYAYTDGSYYDVTGLYTADGKLIGTNDASKDATPVPDTDKLSLKADFSFKYVPMRNIKQLTAYIDGEQIESETNIGFENYNKKATTIASQQIDFSIKDLAEGEHMLTLDAKLPDNGNALSALRLPFTLDFTAPTLSLGRYIRDGKQYVRVDATDSNYLQYLTVGSSKLMMNSQKGETVSKVYSVSTTATSLTVSAVDYAGNSASQTFSMVITDTAGNKYYSLRDAVDAAPSGSSTLYMSNYLETINEPITVPSGKTINLNGSATFVRSDKLNSPSVIALGGLNLLSSNIKGLDIAKIPTITAPSFSGDTAMTVKLSAAIDSDYLSVYVASYNSENPSSLSAEKTLVDAVRIDNAKESNAITIQRGNFYSIFIWDSATMTPYAKKSYKRQ